MPHCLSAAMGSSFALSHYWQELSDRFRRLELVARQRKEKCEYATLSFLHIALTYDIIFV